MLSLISGPSRTADIEKTLVMGAHGPKEFILFLIDDTPH
jgi:L-lactate dehydrogenase complex protein LldG